MVWYEAATNKTWLYQDQLGSVIGTANSAGTSTAIHSYGPYGEPNIATGIRFRYTGQQFLGSLNLYYYKARFYSPALGRFLQTDPIGTQDDLNLYAYVGNNPINRFDPFGLSAAESNQLNSGIGGSQSGPSFTGERIDVAYCIPCVPPAVTAAGKAATAVGGFVGGLWLGGKANVLYNEAEDSSGNNNPYTGPVSKPVVIVDQHGNAIPIGTGQQVNASPNGDYQQVIGADGKPTGDRLDRGGHKGQSDPSAQGPHGHRPGVTTPDGNPHLPIYP